MKKRKLGKNRGIWCGTIVSELKKSHELKNRRTDEVIETFYKFDVEAEIKNRKGEVKNVSVLPVIVKQSILDTLQEDIAVGKIVFVKGSWRTRDYANAEEQKAKLEQYIFAKNVELHDEEPTKTKNKFEFDGVLVKKLFEFERDKDGAPKKESGKLIPKLDKEGNKIWTTRKNKEGFVVNDFIVAINRSNGSDYVPCISYKKLAEHIAKEIEIGSEVTGSGYIRSRSYNGGLAYEAVITQLERKETAENEPPEETEE